MTEASAFSSPSGVSELSISSGASELSKSSGSSELSISSESSRSFESSEFPGSSDSSGSTLNPGSSSISSDGFAAGASISASSVPAEEPFPLPQAARLIARAAVRQQNILLFIFCISFPVYSLPAPIVPVSASLFGIRCRNFEIALFMCFSPYCRGCSDCLTKNSGKMTLGRKSPDNLRSVLWKASPHTQG